MSNYYTYFRNLYKFINITNLKDSDNNSKLYNINQKLYLLIYLIGESEGSS
jgi:hypothetical protein